CKKVGHIIQNFGTPATANNQRTRTCYECGSLRHYKSACPIVKFHEHVDMIHGRMRTSKPKTMQDAMEIATKLRNKKISTLVECETENKERPIWGCYTHSDISLPDYEAFSFNNDHIEEISSGSTTTHSDISLPDYEAFSFNNDHIEEISSGSTTTHSDISLSKYDSFVFDSSNDQFPPTDRNDLTHEEFADELAHIISPPEYDYFYFRNLPDLGELMSILNSRIRENLSYTTCVNLPIEDDHSPLLAYVVWIFLAYLTYPVIPPYLHPFGNEDTIFDPGITINRVYSFKPGLSHRYGAFKKFNTHRSHLNECLMIINGKNTPILDVLLFHLYPP
nr:hypothetical protein [Tanacetum cinerariifolium]